jgi:hypothetical protein
MTREPISTVVPLAFAPSGSPSVSSGNVAGRAWSILVAPTRRLVRRDRRAVVRSVLAAGSVGVRPALGISARSAWCIGAFPGGRVKLVAPRAWVLSRHIDRHGSSLSRFTLFAVRSVVVLVITGAVMAVRNEWLGVRLVAKGAARCVALGDDFFSRGWWACRERHRVRCAGMMQGMSGHG